MDVSISAKIGTSLLFIHVHFYFEDAGEGKCRQKRKSKATCACIHACMWSLHIQAVSVTQVTCGLKNTKTPLHMQNKSHNFTCTH